MDNITITIDRSYALFTPQCNNFCSKIDKYSGKLELVPEEVTALKQGNLYLQYVHNRENEVQTFGHSMVDYKQLITYGHGNQVLSEMPVLSALPTTLPGTPMVNMWGAMNKLAHKCADHKSFNSSIGEDLGIIKPVTVPKPEEGVPNLTAKLANGGHPILHATKGIYQGYQVWRDSGDGKGYVLIAVSLYADYLDTTALPAIGTNAIWKYKAIYILKGEVVGNWSAELSIMVYGNV